MDNNPIENLLVMIKDAVETRKICLKLSVAENLTRSSGYVDEKIFSRPQVINFFLLVAKRVQHFYKVH